MNGEAAQAASFFLPAEDLTALVPLGGGIVNDTFRVTLRSGEKYILQRLNPAVFPDPAAVQENLVRVTSHMQAILERSPAPGLTLFRPVRNPAGKLMYTEPDGSCWRLLTCIDNTCSLRSISTPAQAKEIGRALGQFHRLVATLPSAALKDPLPGFHNTPLYLARYDNLLLSPLNALNKEAEDCRNFIEQRRGEVFLLENARQQGLITSQVVHGDPKVANFLFSPDGQRVHSLIDLDTVRPGLLLHDLGDCLRSCCNPLGEEVGNPEDAVFAADFFAAAVDGYLRSAADLLTAKDMELFVDSVGLISFELGLRFYSDYLADNCYFKVDYPEHNLFRARVQFALVRSIEEQYSRLTALSR
ncbi:MAG: phosphotransferase enzyme family protein [Candidatus Electrothrix sp. YB6]